MLKLLTVTALLAAPATNAPPPCVTRGEIREMTQALLPVGLDAAAEACRASLPPTAFLLTGGRALSERLKEGGDAHWGASLAAIRRFSDMKDMPEGLKPATVQALVRDMATTELKKGLKPPDCSFANDLAETLAPLSADGLARLAVAGLMVAQKSEKSKSRRVPALCPAAAQ